MIHIVSTALKLALCIFLSFEQSCGSSRLVHLFAKGATDGCGQISTRSLVESTLRLKGSGQDSGIPEVEEEKYAQREALWEKMRQEWEWCTAVEGGRVLNPISEELPMKPEWYHHKWNIDGLDPGPEVWRNPPKEFRQKGLTVDPNTAPIQELLNDVLRQIAEDNKEDERLRREGPDYHPPQEYDEEGKPIYQYWDREIGTKPWPNFQDQLPRGWRQIRFAGSCFILAADGTFVHTDDPNNHDPSTWGASPDDRGEWNCDGPTWEESRVLTLRFHDEERTEANFKLHCEKTFAGQPWAYTGEIAADKWVEEHQGNILEAQACDDDECEACTELQQEDPDPPEHLYSLPADDRDPI